MGRGTYFDIPRHLNAATHVLALRLFKEAPTKLSPFDRLAVEGVLYQVFLASTGLWLDEDVNHRVDFGFDLQFWLQAEQWLDHSKFFPGQSHSTNSPVLGVPVSLFRLVLTLKKMYQGAVLYDDGTLHELRSEIEIWEGLVLRDEETDELSDTEKRNHKHSFYKSASYLFILIISLQGEQLSQPRVTPDRDTDDSEDQTKPRSRPPLAADPDSWQIQKAVQILKSHENDDEWASCFIGNWPVYSIGFFMARSEHVQLARNDLRRRWDLTKFNQVARFCNDLEKTWEQRGLLMKKGVELVGRCSSGTYYRQNSAS
jgi:hypothetical protein